MRRLSVLGGIAAVVQGLGLASLVVILFMVLPSLGYTLEQLAEPETGLRFVRDQPLLFFWMTAVAGVLFDAFSIILLLAIHERLQPGSPRLMNASSAFGLLSLFLFLIAALLNYSGMSRLAELGAGSAEDVGGAYLALDAAIASLRGGANFAAGLWFLLFSWAALRHGGLPRAMAFSGLVVAAINLLALLGLELAIVVNVAWFVALGIVLLGKPRAPALAAGRLERPEVAP